MSKPLTASFSGAISVIETKIAALEKASNLASEALEVRLHSMNEFRTQLKDQAASFVRREEHELRISRLDGDTHVVRERLVAMDATLTSLLTRITAITDLCSKLVNDRSTFVTEALYDERQAVFAARIAGLEATIARVTGIAITLAGLSGLAGVFISHLLKSL